MLVIYITGIIILKIVLLIGSKLINGSGSNITSFKIVTIKLIYMNRTIWDWRTLIQELLRKKELSRASDIVNLMAYIAIGNMETAEEIYNRCGNWIEREYPMGA